MTTRERELADIEPTYQARYQELLTLQESLREAQSRVESLYGKQGRGRQFATEEQRNAFLQSQIDSLNEQVTGGEGLVVPVNIHYELCLCLSTCISYCKACETYYVYYTYNYINVFDIVKIVIHSSIPLSIHSLHILSPQIRSKSALLQRVQTETAQQEASLRQEMSRNAAAVQENQTQLEGLEGLGR